MLQINFAGKKILWGQQGIRRTGVQYGKVWLYIYIYMDALLVVAVSAGLEQGGISDNSSYYRFGVI